MKTEAPALLTEEEFRNSLFLIGEERYHHRHPFHLLMHEGKLTQGQLQAWALNRYYYQSRIPMKDKIIMARTSDQNYRQEIAFSTRGDRNGIWAFNASYDQSGATIGRFGPASQITDISSAGGALLNAKRNFGLKERNPSITINASGQDFVSWERLDKQRFSDVDVCESGILVCNTYFGTRSWVGGPNNIRNIRQINGLTLIRAPYYSMPDYDGNCNPSITGFPKSRSLNLPKALPTTLLRSSPGGEDRAPVELCFWRKSEMVNFVGGDIQEDFLLKYLYKEPRASPTQGQGTWKYFKDNQVIGQWPHLSFGQYNSGNNFTFSGERFGSSYVANTENDLDFLTTWNGAAKGTFDTIQNEKFYRSETRAKDTSTFRFIWGNVFVGDTLSGLPMRQVILYHGFNDTGYVSISDERDSIFRTETFDMPVGASIKYYRAVSWSDSLAVLPGGTFYDPTVSMIYTVELVRPSGVIDTIERVKFSPYYGFTPLPTNVTINNYDTLAKDVILRVRGTMIGLNDADSMCEMACISTLSDCVFPIMRDTAFSLYKIGYPQTIPETYHLNVMGIYPNPVLNSGKDFSAVVSYIKGYPIKIAVVDLMGRVLQTQNVEASGWWQNITLLKPEASGSYYIFINAGGEKKMLHITVLK